MPAGSQFDVLGLGAVAVDDLLYVNRYPEPDTKVPLQRQQRQCGGLAGAALITAARLGFQCAYAGVLGEDELSEFVAATLKAEGVDLTHLIRQDDARPFHSTIIVDMGRKTRTIFFGTDGVVGADPELPCADVIRSTRVLLVDHVGIDGMIRAARIARESGINIVADCERSKSARMSELLELVNHLIVPHQFACEVTAEREPARAVQALWNDGRDTVIVTAGPRGCWYMTGPDGDCVGHQSAFEVEVVDTTGCGDVFHGAYASALLMGLEPLDRIRFASATAAIKATRGNGEKGIPDRSAVEEFLQDRA